MVKYPNYLSGSQDDINKRLLEMILKLQKSEGADVGKLSDAVDDLETVVGDSDSGLVKDVADIETAIGDESTADTILYRIKALEDAT